MKEQLITFETAKLAKEKGFENKTPHKLRRDYYNSFGNLNGDVTEYIKAKVNNKNTKSLEPVDVPTQSLLQKWLREEHDIDVYIIPNGSRNKSICERLYHPQLWYKDKYQTELHSKYTYEEALEKGLQEALNLI